MLLFVPSQTVAIQRDEDRVIVENGQIRLTIERRTGLIDVVWSGEGSVQSIAAEARLTDGRTLKTRDYPRHLTGKADVRRIEDAFGAGVRVIIHNLALDRPELRTVLWVYADHPEAIVQTEVVSNDPIGSNEIAPIVANVVSSGTEGTRQSLFVPYDNDAYVRYRSNADGATSHEVSALYDAGTRRGFVVGSIDHDLWKSGVSFKAGLRAFCGYADAGSHDREPHGAITGRTVKSPRFVLGLYSDWRTGLERYGDLNALVRPPLPWKGGVPFGWNSWSAFRDKLTSADARKAVESIADLSSFRNGGTAYVNLDSYWDNLKPDDLSEFVRLVHASGLKAGIYWTPFVAWGVLDRVVQGDHHGYRYVDLALKDGQGKPLPKLDGGWPLDPSHPGTLARIDRQLKAFVAQGFDYVKLDFLSHGALEGRRFDHRVPTGTAAYGLGMKRITDDLSSRRIGRPFFISESIAPLFPHGYAHSRRISCDVFANIGASEYLLNSANYAWWEAGRLYRFSDPDSAPVYQAAGEEPSTEAEARTRFVASVVSGGMMTLGDDLGKPEARARVTQLLSNEEALDIARRRSPFRPVDGDTGAKAGDAFVRLDGDGAYVALFNYEKASSIVRALPLRKFGLPKGTWICRNVLTGERHSLRDVLTVDLLPMDCALLRLSRGYVLG